MNNLFEPDDLNIVEDALEIDIDCLNDESLKDAGDAIQAISNLYHDKKYLDKHPDIKARVDLELETLRGLIKMRKANEISHDKILESLQTRADNASLYRALTELQKTAIALSNKIHDTFEKLNNLCISEQPENNNIEEDEETEEKISSIHRGSKSFIQQALEDE